MAFYLSAGITALFAIAISYWTCVHQRGRIEAKTPHIIYFIALVVFSVLTFSQVEFRLDNVLNIIAPAILIGLSAIPWLIALMLHWSAQSVSRLEWAEEGSILDLFRKADIALQQHDDSLAIDLLEDALLEYDEKVSILQKLYAILLDQGKAEDAGHYLRSAVLLEEKTAKKSSMRFELAELYRSRLQDLDRATEVLKEVCDEHPNTPFDRKARGMLKHWGAAPS